MEKMTCVFGDLTALYNARLNDRKQINYKLLDSLLKKELEVESFDESFFYTIYSEQNEKQVSFVKGLKELGWNVETINPRDIPRDVPWSKHRFDTRITYEMSFGGDKLLLLTDSFELYPIIEKIKQEKPDTEVYLAFFASSLDNRWWKVLNNGMVNFVDLDEILSKN